MKTKRALIVVDVQKDFCPGGSLAVPDGDTIVPTINDLLPQFDLVIFTKDWHPDNHNYFASSHPDVNPFDIVEGEVVWPDHCVENTPGADLHPDLDLSKCKKDFYIFKKGTNVDAQGYSAFEDGDLREFLDEKEITEVYICGLATDYCVKNTAIDAAFSGYITYVLADACKSIDVDLSKTKEELYEAGVYFVDCWAVGL